MDESIGKLLQKNRLKQKIKLEDVENELKIKVKFLEFLENDKFENFISETQAKGFLKNYSNFLGINPKVVQALYKKDIVNKGMFLRIKKEEAKKEVIAPPLDVGKVFKGVAFTRKRFAGFLFLVFVVIFGIGAYQLVNLALRQPKLNITEPFDLESGYSGTITYKESSIILEGQTEDSVSITINEEPVNIDSSFKFKSSLIPTTQEETLINIVAKNFWGTESKIQINLSKEKQKIEDMNFKLQVLGDDSILIKSDDVIIRESSIKKDDVIEFTSKNSVEIQITNPSNLKIFVNEDEYPIQNSLIKFINNGDSILVE